MLVSVAHVSPSFSVCRGCAVPDGGGPQTDTSAARGDGWYSKLKDSLAVSYGTLQISRQEEEGSYVLYFTNRIIAIMFLCLVVRLHSDVFPNKTQL